MLYALMRTFAAYCKAKRYVKLTSRKVTGNFTVNNVKGDNKGWVFSTATKRKQFWPVTSNSSMENYCRLFLRVESVGYHYKYRNCIGLVPSCLNNWRTLSAAGLPRTLAKMNRPRLHCPSKGCLISTSTRHRTCRRANCESRIYPSS